MELRCGAWGLACLARRIRDRAASDFTVAVTVKEGREADARVMGMASTP